MCTKWAYKRSAPGSVHLQYLIPNFEWGKLIGRHINLLSLLRGNKLYPPTLPPTPLPDTHLHQSPPNKKIYQFNNHTFYKNEIMGEGLRLISLNSCFTDLSLLWFPLLVCSCEERK